MRDAIGRVMVDFTQMRVFERDPLVLTRGDGVRVWDTDGREYIDAVSSVITVNLGYGNRRVIDAISAQLERLPIAAPTLGTSDRMLELADRLLGLLPPDMTTVKFQTSGSESVEAAFKLARQYHRQTGAPGRHKIIAREHSYHGATMGALSATGRAEYRIPFEPLVPGFVHVPAPDERGCRLSSACPPCPLACADAIEDAILREGPETVAAVIVEPVMAMAGVVIPPDGYLPKLRAICDRHSVLLIFDEVVTGFGRLGTWFGAERFATWPDLLVLGKGITSGYAPLSAVALRDHVAAAFSGEPDEHVQFLSGHTFGGNPVACAAALAVIDEIEDRVLIEHGRAMGELLGQQLRSMAARHDAGWAVRSIGLLACVDLESEAAAAAMVREARRLGVLTLPSSHHGVRVAPPLTIERTDIENITAALDEALACVTAGTAR